MLTLAFESSAKAASAALCDGERLIALTVQCSGLTHSRTLLPMAEDLLKNTDVNMADIDCFAVAQGPGSFTGIRIGVSTVKGLAWAAEKPCIGVSTLAAMAWNGAAAGGLICAVMDARRSEVYRRGRRRHHRSVSEGESAAVSPGARKPALAECLGCGHGGLRQTAAVLAGAAAHLSSPLAGGARASGENAEGKAAGFVR